MEKDHVYTYTNMMFAQELVRHNGLNQLEANEVMKTVFNTIRKGLVEDEAHVRLYGIGTLMVTKKAARKGRNPQTGETIQIPARRSVNFRLSAKLRDDLNPKKNKGKKSNK